MARQRGMFANCTLIIVSLLKLWKVSVGSDDANVTSRKVHTRNWKNIFKISKAANWIIVAILITPHTQRERGKVIDRGVHIYIYICLWSKKNLNRTLEIYSPFQALTVGLLVEFID